MAAGTDFGADGEAVNPGRRRGANVNRQRADARSGSSGRAELTDYWLACFVCFAWSAAGTVPPWGLWRRHQSGLSAAAGGVVLSPRLLTILLARAMFAAVALAEVVGQE